MPEQSEKCWCLCSLLFCSLFFLNGCSSWQLQERCESTNWFEYSRDVAMTGRYLEEDGFIKDCKKVDRLSATQIDLGFKSGRERYCTYDSFFRNGEIGEPVNFKMCDNLILYQMQERYAQGLQSFCTPQVGYAHGANGKLYKNVCFKRDEEDFLKPYLKGRSEFLRQSIAQLEIEISALHELQKQLQPQIDLISAEIRSLPHLKECKKGSFYNSKSKHEEAFVSCEEPFHLRNRRDLLYSQMDRLRDQFAAHGKSVERIQTQLEHNRTELTKVPVSVLEGISIVKPIKESSGQVQRP